MVTMTRELERGLIEAGVPEERAREIVDGLEIRLSELATKEDLERELSAFRRELDYRFEAIDHRFEAIDHRFDGVEARLDEMNKRLELLERTMWRIFSWLAALLTAMIATLLGALLYAVFGA